MDSRASKMLIKPFIRNNKVDMSDVLNCHYVSFNAFFTRELKPDARPIDMSPNALISPCDGLVSVYPITPEGVFNVKGTPYTLGSLIENEALAQEYTGGYCFSFRLTSADYHHYVYPDDCEIVARAHIKGGYHTVRHYAHSAYPVFKTNTREWTLLRTRHFGDMLIIEVGAMLVGRIVNLAVSGEFRRGEEKGRFEFGGSTILIAVKAGILSPRGELTRNTEQMRETRVRLGERVADA